MKQLIVAMCASTVALGVGCSGGEAVGTVPDIINSSRGANFNSDQPAESSDQPLFGSEQPLGNTQQPDFNAQQPESSTPTGGPFDCTELCEAIPSCGDVEEYQRDRAECFQLCEVGFYDAIFEMCGGVFGELVDCALAQGFVCNDGQARVFGCEHLADDLENCFDNVDFNDLPTPDTGGRDQVVMICDNGATEITVSERCDGSLDCEDGLDEAACQ